eukprot:TRINITY_DN46059_c0_g1_i1.p2 TRINITY_DN46059_c0_g1~~TRINITY_DN46059_c0_g1_i1.p2  ORF type:complete len:201 (+),score=19.36 TRINITY_DN46059_c0_g1_i1:28-630(+)
MASQQGSLDAATKQDIVAFMKKLTKRNLRRELRTSQFALCGAVGITLYALANALRVRASCQQATGIVTDTWKNNFGVMWAQYAYEVDGKQYTSSRITPQFPWLNYIWSFSVQPQAVGEETTVWYMPKKPEESYVLIKGAATWLPVFLVGLLGFGAGTRMMRVRKLMSVKQEWSKAQKTYKMVAARRRVPDPVPRAEAAVA